MVSSFSGTGKPRYHYNFFGIKRYDVTSPATLAPGRHTVSLEFVPDAPKPGVPANVTLIVDGTAVANGRIDEQIPMRCGTETMDIGMDCVSPVCEEYGHLGLFPFSGTIESVTLTLGEGHQPTGMERLELATKMD